GSALARRPSSPIFRSWHDPRDSALTLTQHPAGGGGVRGRGRGDGLPARGAGDDAADLPQLADEGAGGGRPRDRERPAHRGGGRGRRRGGPRHGRRVMALVWRPFQALSVHPRARLPDRGGAASMNPRQFLALARTLAAAATEEAWRSAVSRAYY